jgi:hypothetical protein
MKKYLIKELSDERIDEILNSDEAKMVFLKRSQMFMYIKKAIDKGNSLEKLKSLALQALSDTDKEKEMMELLWGDTKNAGAFLKEFKDAILASNLKFPDLLSTYGDEVIVDLPSSISSLFDNFIGHYNAEVGMLFAPVPDDSLLFPDDSLNYEMIDSIGFAVFEGQIPFSELCGGRPNRIRLYACCLASGVILAGAGPLGFAFGFWRCWCWFCEQNSELAKQICPQSVPDSL